MNKMTLFCSTVARPAHGGGWWLMNKRETGYSSSVYGLPATPVPKPYPDLETILEHWNARLGADGADRHGKYVEVDPA